MNHIRRRHSGFTLLELILAMAVTCMLAMSLYASLRIGLKSRDKAREAVDPARQAQVALELIGRDLENAFTVGTAGGIMTTPFSGMDGGAGGVGDVLEFSAMNSGVDDGDPAHDDGMKKIDLDVETLADGTQALVRRVNPLNMLTQQAPVDDLEVLCRNVTAFNARYLSNDVWTDSWDPQAMQNATPAAVELTLDIQRPGANPNDPPYHVVRTFALPMGGP